MASIDTFKSQFIGGARPTQYEIMIPSFGSKGRFQCKGGQIPGLNLSGPIEVRYQGFPLKIAGDVIAYDNWTVTIMEDQDWAIRTALDNWVKRVYDVETGTRGAYSDYVEDAIVTQFGLDGESPIAKYKIIDIWPQTVSPIELSYESVDTIEEYTVDFSFLKVIPLM